MCLEGVHLRMLAIFATAIALFAPSTVETVAGSTASGSGSDGASDVSRICLALIPGLDRRLADLDSHSVTYSYVLYGPRDGEAPTFEIPNDAEDKDRVQLIKVAVVYKSGPAYRIHEHTVWTRRDSGLDEIVTFTSDGSQFHTRFAHASGGRSNLMLDLTDSMHRVDAEMDAYGWRVLGQVAPLTYQQYMRWAAASGDLSLVRSSDDELVVQWRFLPDLPQTRVTASIDRSLNALRSIQVDVHSADAESPDAQIVHRKAVELREYPLAGRSVRGARVTDQLTAAGDEWPASWAVAVVTPIAMTPTPLTRDLIYLPPSPTDLVQDTRFDIARPPGETRINLDGLVVTLNREPTTDIGWELDRNLDELSAFAGGVHTLAAPTPEIGPAGAGDGEAIVFDAGDAPIIDALPARVAHDFVISNDSTETWVVKQIVKSCGCLTCELDKKSIAPGERATLSVAMVLPAPGRRRQEVAVIFEDDTVRRFALNARGTMPGRLRVMCSGFTLQNGVWSAEIRAYWVESNAAVLAEPIPPLALEAPDGGSLEFGGWTLIEPVSIDGARPRRLFGRGTVALPVPTFTPPPTEVEELRFTVGEGRNFRLPVIRFDTEHTR